MGSTLEHFEVSWQSLEIKENKTTTSTAICIYYRYKRCLMWYPFYSLPNQTRSMSICGVKISCAIWMLKCENVEDEKTTLTPIGR
jgi:hypothetical protein